MKFKIGSIHTIAIPKQDLKNNVLKAIDGAKVRIESRVDYIKETGYKIKKNEVVVRLLKVVDQSVSRYEGHTIPVPRTWIKASVQKTQQKHKCSCDLKTVLMVTGCKCGGV